MANINIQEGRIEVPGGGEQVEGVPFDVTFRLKNRELFQPGPAVPEACEASLARNGHRARSELTIKGQTEDGRAIDRTLDLGEHCIVATGREAVSAEVTIEEPGEYTLVARAIPLPEIPEGSNPPDTAQADIEVFPSGNTGQEPVDDGGDSDPIFGGGGGTIPGGVDGGGGGSGDGSTVAGLNLLNTVLQNPVKSAIGVAVMGYAANQATNFGDEE